MSGSKCPICDVTYPRLSSHLSKSKCGVLLERGDHIGERNPTPRPMNEVNIPQPRIQNRVDDVRRRSGRKRISRSPAPPRRVINRKLSHIAEQELDDMDPDLLDYQSEFHFAVSNGTTHPPIPPIFESGESGEAFDNLEDASVHATAPTVDMDHAVDDAQETTGSEKGVAPLNLGKPQPYHIQSNTTKLRNVDRVMSRLYQLCDGAGCRRSLGDNIVALLKEERGFDVRDPQIRKRDAVIGRLQKAAQIPYPEAVALTLESGRKVTVYRFPFQPSIQRHLLSQTFSQVENIHVKPEDPWKNQCNYPRNIVELHDGRWYQETAAKYSVEYNPEEYMVHPVLLYIDKTGTDKIDKNSLEPLMATSTILKSKEREKSNNWFPIGLIPSPSSQSTAQKQLHKGQQSKKSLSAREYHQCLEVLLQPLKDLQEGKPVMKFRRGGYICNYRILCPVAGVVGDNLAADLLCGRRGNRTPTTARLSRRCLTTYQESDRTSHTCHHVPSDMIHKLCQGALGCEFGQPQTQEDPLVPSISQSINFEKWRMHLRSLTATSAKLHQSFLQHRKRVCEAVLDGVFCAHPIYSAWTGIDFGATKEGIHRATLSDILHTVEEGVVPKILEVFFGRMGPQQLYSIDKFVEALFSQKANRSGERGNYPRVSFSRGYTRLTMLSADERIGQLFVLALLLRMEKGMELLKGRFHVSFDEKRETAARRFMGKGSASKIGGRVAESSQSSGSSEESDSSDSSTTQPSSSNSSVSSNDSPSGPSQSSNEGDDPQSSHEDDSTTPRTTKKRDPGNKSKAPQEMDMTSLRKVLKAMDLSYIWNHIEPSLSKEHSRIMMRTLRKVVKPAWMNHLAKLQVLPGCMDYQRTACIDVWPEEPLRTQPQQRTSPTSSQTPRMGETVQIERGREGFSIGLNMSQFTFLCELILTYHALLKYGQPRMGTKEEQENYESSFRLLKELLTKGVNRGEGTRQWHLQKFLEMNHFLEDMIDFGISGGYSSSTGERGLKVWAKKPARTAQKRSDEVFSKQVCLRMHEVSLFAATVPEITSPLKEEREGYQDLTRRAFGRNFLYLREETDVQGHMWRLGGGKRVRVYDYPQAILDWFDKQVSTSHARNGVRVFTELSIFESSPETKTPVKHIVRAHHNYQGGGPWNDFTLIRYERVGTFPCKVACFFEAQGSSGELRALVQECTSFKALECTSLISSRWRLASRRRGNRWTPLFQSVSADTISDRIYAIEMDTKGLTYRDAGENFDFLWVEYCRENWALNFLSAHREYHN